MVYKLLAGTLLFGFFAGAPVVPVEVKAECFYGYPVSEKINVVGTYGCTSDGVEDGSQPDFDDIDGSGFISVAKYRNIDGTVSFVQMPNVRYKNLAKKDGIKQNPTKADAESILLAVTRIAKAAVARDATSNSSTAGTSLTYAHTTSGSNVALTTQTWDQATNGIITRVEYNGTLMSTSTDVTCPNNGIGRKLSAFALLGPSGGANNVVVTRFSSTGGPLQSTSVSYTGISQGALPTGGAIASNTASNNDGSLAVTATALSTNNAAVATCVNNNILCSNGTNTSASVATNGDINTFESSPLVIAASGNYTMNFTGTGSGSADSECAIVVIFEPASGGASGGGADGAEIQLGM